MNVMHRELDRLGCEHLLVDPYAERGVQMAHCFVAEERVDDIAKDAFDRMMAFLAEKTNRPKRRGRIEK